MRDSSAPTLLLALAAFASADEMLSINRGVIVHLFEWKWQDVGRECEQFLAPKGYAGVQISPPNENLIIENRPWYERYQPLSYNLTTRSGDERQLADMLARCNGAGVRVFADVVINHMTKADDTAFGCVGTAGSRCSDGERLYPAVPYNRTHFNWPECQIQDYNNATEVRVCELVGLHDLNQTEEYVRARIVDYLNHLVDLGISGFRVDAAKHMFPSDLKAIYDRVKNLNTDHGFPKNTRPLIYQECSANGWEAVGYEEYIPLGLVTDFRYGSFIGTTFHGKNLSNLYNFGEFWNILPENRSVVFIDNHDTERDSNHWLLHHKTPKEYKMAMAFMLARGIGTPQVLSSFEFTTFHDGPPGDYNGDIASPYRAGCGACGKGWICQHRWREVYNMVYFHNATNGLNVTNWWGNGFNQIAFSLGNKGFIAFNAEKNITLDRKLQTGLPAGWYCDILSGEFADGQCCYQDLVHVDGGGLASVYVDESDSDCDSDWCAENNGMIALLDTKLTRCEWGRGDSNTDSSSEEDKWERESKKRRAKSNLKSASFFTKSDIKHA